MRTTENAPCPVNLGDKYTWVPTAFTGPSGPETVERGQMGEVLKVTGMVIQINKEHRWFRVKAIFPGGVLHECFKY